MFADCEYERDVHRGILATRWLISAVCERAGRTCIWPAGSRFVRSDCSTLVLKLAHAARLLDRHGLARLLCRRCWQR